MKRRVFGESVQGASHKRVDKECQDSFKKIEYDDGTVIMAIADGHGSKRNVRLARRPLALGIQKGAVREYVCL